jgi:hypothetical protein
MQVDLLRRAGPRRRLEMVLSLSRSATELARIGLRRSRPGASEREIEIEFVALHYGRELAERLERNLAARS